MKDESIGKCVRCKQPVRRSQEFEAVPNDGTVDDGPGDAWLWHARCAELSARESAQMAEDFDAFERSLYASQDEYEAEKAAYEAWLTEEVDA